MITSSAVPHRTTARARAVPFGCAVLGGTALLTAVAMTADPSGFLNEVGGFGAVNDHLVRDIATWSAALGAGLLVAVRVVAWRVPLLAITVIQGVLHAINHAFDAGLADPSWKGWVNVALVGSVSLIALWLLIAARAEEQR